MVAHATAAGGDGTIMDSGATAATLALRRLAATLERSGTPLERVFAPHMKVRE